MSKIVKRIIGAVLAVILAGSVGLNIFLFPMVRQNNEIWNIHYPDANSRDSYYSIHNVKTAHEVSKGQGVKVGILDWGFGFAEHTDLYEGGKDFCEWQYHDENFNYAEEHGFWMAQTLKEIAPEAMVYALGTFTPDNEDEWVDNMIEAIEWSVENDLDILTLSHQALSEKNRPRFDEAVNKAVDQGIVTTFIHYDNPVNLLPWGIWDWQGEEGYSRAPDMNIFQYDYNTLFINNYGEIQGRADYGKVYKEQLHLSISSMSVVTAGFVAILKSVDDTLTPAEYKEILVNTSRYMEYEEDSAEHVVDIAAAVQYLKDKNSADIP